MKINKQKKVKVDIIIFICLLLVGAYVYHLISYSSSVSGLSKESDDIKEKVEKRIHRENVIEGAIIDCNNDSITCPSGKGESAEVMYHSYATIIGYNDYSGSFGLRDRFSEYLYTAQQSTDEGATIKLTIDTQLQEKIYYMLLDKNASAIVLDNSTGRILALVSTFGGVDVDVNLFHENYDAYESAGFFFPNAINGSDPPGSAYKVVTVASVVEQGEQNEDYFDTGSFYLTDNTVISNDEGRAFGHIDARQALSFSCNTYFASYAVKHKKQFIDISDRFLVGHEIQLDFTTLSSNNLEHSDSYNVTAMSGFGQGAITLSPLHLAMITQSIANKGKMMKPYLIDCIYSEKNVLYHGQEEMLCIPISEAVAEEVSQYMSYTAEEHGALGISSKTGTADYDSGSTHAVYISFNDNYTVVLTEKGTSDYGLSLQDHALTIFEMLNK